MAATRTSATPRPIELYRPGAFDRAGLRDMRLRSIANFMLGFLEAFASALGLTKSEWRARGARNAVTTQLPTGEQHLDKLYLHVHVHEGNHRAIRFYEKNGAVPTGEYLDDPRGASEPHLEMVLATAR